MRFELVCQSMSRIKMSLICYDNSTQGICGFRSSLNDGDLRALHIRKYQLTI